MSNFVIRVADMPHYNGHPDVVQHTVNFTDEAIEAAFVRLWLHPRFARVTADEEVVVRVAVERHRKPNGPQTHYDILAQVPIVPEDWGNR